MATQTATTGNLENAQRIAIAKARYTAEHNAPCVNLIEHMTLKQGEKQVTVPKVGQMTASDLTDGIDIVDTEDISMTTTDLTTAEVGMKVILTDKLLRQENESVFAMVGVQMGDGMARKKDTDVLALFESLNGGTDLGADDKNLTVTNLAACISVAKAKKYPSPISVVHHPNAVYQITKTMTITPGSTYPIPHGYAEDLLKDFYRMTLNQVGVFEDGNIAKYGGEDSGYGAIFSKSAMVILESQAQRPERERDASLRAWELVLTSDYGCFELDDGYGAPMLYEIGDHATNN